MKLAGIAALLLLATASVTAQDYPKAGSGPTKSGLKVVGFKKKHLAFSDWQTMLTYYNSYEMSDVERLYFVQRIVDSGKAFEISAGSSGELLETRSLKKIDAYCVRFTSGNHKNGTAWTTNYENGMFYK